MSHHVRTKLDELKRQEVSRLRMLIKAKMDATMEQSKCLDAWVPPWPREVDQGLVGQSRRGKVTTPGLYPSSGRREGVLVG